MTSNEKKRVLFLCTYNSARSILAEALLNATSPEHYIGFSAGTHPTKVRKQTLKVLEEEKIAINHLYSKSLDQFLNQTFDWVITTCDDARDECPFFPGAKNRLHWSLPDPSEVQGSEEEMLNAFRHTKNSLKELIKNFINQTCPKE